MVQETNRYNKKFIKNKINNKEPNDEMIQEANLENIKINDKKILMTKMPKKANLTNYNFNIKEYEKLNYNKENMSKSIINSPNKVYKII